MTQVLLPTQLLSSSGIKGNSPIGNGVSNPVQLLQSVQNGSYKPPVIQLPQSKPNPVSQSKPTQQQPNLLQQTENAGQNLLSSATNAAKNIISEVKGLFTPEGGKPQPIVASKPAPTPTVNLTPSQQQAVGTLKPGQMIPDFSSSQQTTSASAKIKKPAQQPGNIIDTLFALPDKAITAAQDYLAKPEHQNITQPLGEVQKYIVNPIIQNPVLRPIIKGISETYLGDSKKVMDTFNTPLDKPTSLAGKTYNTVGEVAGQALSFLAGGEVLKGLKFGKATLPVLFATIGQTSSPSDTTAMQRLEKAPVDAIAGWLLGSVPAAKKIISVEALKQAGLSSAIVSANSLVDSMIQGLPVKDAAKVAGQMAVIAGIFHITGSATGLIAKKALSSEYKNGSAEFTPDQARSVVVGSNLEKTHLGNEIMKASLDAQAQGKNLKIDLSAAKESPIAGVVKKFTTLQTPNGIRVNNIELVEPTTKNIAAETQPPAAQPETQPTTAAAPKIPNEQEAQEINQALTHVRPAPNPIEENSTNELIKNPIGMREQYLQKFGNEVNTDNARELFSDYKGYNASDVHNAAAGLRSIVLEHLLDVKKGTGNNTVLFTAGGSGAGKTSAIADKLPNKEDYPIINDTTLGSKTGIKTIEQSLAKGYDVQIAYVSRDPIASWKSALTRNRIITENGHVDQHIKSLENIIKLHEQYKDNPHVHFTFIDNNGERGNAKVVDIAHLKNISYNKSELQQKVQEETNKAYEQGHFQNHFKENAEQYFKGFTSDRNESGNRGQSEPQRQEKSTEINSSSPKEKIPTEKNISGKSPETSTTPLPYPKTLDISDLASKPMEKPGGGVGEGSTKGDRETYGFHAKNLEQPFSPKATETLQGIVKQSDIAKGLSEKLNVPIRHGKFRSAGAIGVYKGKPKVVRVKSGGLNTVFHEVGHYLDDTIGFSKDISDEEAKNLLQEYGRQYKDAGLRRKEAFAEYLRFDLTGQTEKIKQWAPEFDKTFQEKIKELPQIQEVLDSAKKDFKRWQEQPAVSKILSQMSIGEQKKDSLVSRTIQTMHDLYTSSLDDLHPLSEFSNLATKKVGKIAAEKDPYILARNLRGWVGKADLFLNKGTFGKDYWTVDDNGKSKISFKGKGYSEIMHPVEKAGNLDDFRVYIVAQRIVNDLAPRDIKTGISLDDAKQALEELNKKHPEFEKIAEERRTYKDQLLEFARDNGVLGDKGLAKIRELNKFHAPFYRVMEETQTKFLGKTKIGGNIGNPIKKIRGSELDIIDPLESDVKDTYAIINASERNNIGVAMANIASQNHELGRLFEEVVRPMKPITVNAKEVFEKAFKGTDFGEVPVPEELAELMVTLFRPTYATGANMLNVNMGDKQKVFEVDSDLFKAIQGLNVEDVGIIMKILALPAKALRAGATLSPDFSVRNPLRDQFTAFVYSKYGFIPGIDLVRGMFELFKKGNTYDLWKAAGGEHAMFVSLDRGALQKNFKEIFEGKGLKGIDFVKNPLKMLQIISELGEAGTRLGEMRNALARGASPVEAAYASRNVTLDFARIGAKTKAVNAIIAFFNANIQGSDTMIRNFKKNPFSTLFKVLLGITLPSVLLYLANRKDPRWKEIPAWQKDLFWIVLTPDHIWRIPKPFELGVLFGSVPERALEVMDTKDPSLMNELENTIAQGFTPGFIPTALIPIIENITNYSMFLNRPIVSQGKEGLPPPQQSGTYTTEVSKILGQALNYSPAKIDNLINGYAGGLGKYAVSGLDGILRGTGIVKTPPQPANILEDQPVIKAYMIRPPVGTGSESVNKVYSMYQTSNAQLTYVKQLIKAGQPKEALAYVKEHPDTVQGIVLANTVSTFSTLNKAIDMVRQSQTLSSQVKAKKILSIQTLETTVAEKVLTQLQKKK